MVANKEDNLFTNERYGPLRNVRNELFPKENYILADKALSFETNMHQVRMSEKTSGVTERLWIQVRSCVEKKVDNVHLRVRDSILIKVKYFQFQTDSTTMAPWRP